MIISLKSNKTRQFVANHLTNREILNLIGIKPIKVEFLKQSKTYMIVDHPRHRLTEAEVKRYFHVIEGSMDDTPAKPKTIMANLNEHSMAFGRLSLHYQDFADKFADKPVLLTEDTEFGGNKRWKTVSSQPGDRVFRIWEKDLETYFDTHQAPIDVYEQYRTAVATAMEAMPPVEQSTVNLQHAIQVARCPNGVKAVPEQNLERFDIKVKSVIINQEVTFDNLESFIEELREKFK